MEGVRHCQRQNPSDWWEGTLGSFPHDHSRRQESGFVVTGEYPKPQEAYADLPVVTTIGKNTKYVLSVWSEEQHSSRGYITYVYSSIIWSSLCLMTTCQTGHIDCSSNSQSDGQLETRKIGTLLSFLSSGMLWVLAPSLGISLSFSRG